MAIAAALLLWAAPATANDAACGRVLGAGAIFDAGRGTCVAPNTIEQHCMQLPGYIRWQRTARLGTCEFAVPRTGASRLPPPPAPGGADLRVPAGCAEAKQNIDWVMLRDAGAWRSYSSARRRSGPYDSLLFAQRHNPHARLTIQRCAGWADAYARMLERNGRQPDGSVPDGPKAPELARWAAIAAAYSGEPVIEPVSGFSAAWEAERAALAQCHSKARRCQVVRLFNRGCFYVAGGFNSRGKFVHGPPSISENSATAACSLQGAVYCNRPVGRCAG